ncbi:MAG: hypothetical protein R2713_02125 [Ilumatobacteraceae bacterium]
MAGDERDIGERRRDQGLDRVVLTADDAKATFDMFRNEMTAELGYGEMQATESGAGDQYGAVASFSGAYDVFFTVSVDPSQDGQAVVAMTVNQTNG